MVFVDIMQSMNTINLILAKSSNNIIGNKNKLPWHLPEDLLYFKNLTKDKIVVMGRKTWESLPTKSRPLLNRTNIVLTNQLYYSDLLFTKEEDFNYKLKFLNNKEDLLNYCNTFYQNKEIFIIGGLSIYTQFLPLASTLYITEIHQIVEGDTQAPVFDNRWKEEKRESFISSTGIPYSFVTYKR